MLKGKRTLIAFVVGTLLISACLFLTRDKPDNFTSLMSVWVAIQAVFIGGNKTQEYLDGSKKENNKSETSFKARKDDEKGETQERN